MDYDLIVVGEGFAGLTCAAEAASQGLKVATFEAAFFGGLVVNVNELHEFEPGEGLSGMDYAGSLAAANKRAGVKSTSAEVRAIRPAEGGFEVEAGVGKPTARFVVIATGGQLKKLGVPGEEEFEGRGVSHCADCDAPMFTGAEVVVAGGGDWALQDAMILAPECALVHVVHEGAQPTACPAYLQRAQADPKIRFHPGRTVEAVLGNDGGMTGVRLRGPNGSVNDLQAAGLFTVIGLEPNSALAPAGVRRDTEGFLVVDGNLETDVPGLWAIGQVRSGFGGWLKDAVADARHAAGIVKARAG